MVSFFFGFWVFNLKIYKKKKKNNKQKKKKKKKKKNNNKHPPSPLFLFLNKINI
jgi:hypothetical protein